MQHLVCIISSETRVCFMRNPQHDIKVCNIEIPGSGLPEKYDRGVGGGVSKS